MRNWSKPGCFPRSSAERAVQVADVVRTSRCRHPGVFGAPLDSGRHDVEPEADRDSGRHDVEPEADRDTDLGRVERDEPHG